MAKAYWITYRIADIGDYDARHKALNEAISSIAGGKWWIEPTSFFLFRSDLSIKEVARVVQNAIDPGTDLALIGMPDYKSAVAVGATTDPDLFDLLPITQKL